MKKLKADFKAGGVKDPLLDKLKVKRFSSKSLRRSMATNMYLAGASDAQIMRIGKWKDVETMLRYLEAYNPFKARLNASDVVFGSEQRLTDAVELARAAGAVDAEGFVSPDDVALLLWMLNDAIGVAKQLRVALALRAAAMEGQSGAATSVAQVAGGAAAMVCAAALAVEAGTEGRLELLVSAGAASTAHPEGSTVGGVAALSLRVGAMCAAVRGAAGVSPAPVVSARVEPVMSEAEAAAARAAAISASAAAISDRSWQHFDTNQ